MGIATDAQAGTDLGHGTFEVARYAAGDLRFSSTGCPRSLCSSDHDEIDEDGCGIILRQLVFLFDAEIYRETRASGLVRLEPATSSVFQESGSGTPLEHPLENSFAGRSGAETVNEGNYSENEKSFFQNSSAARSVASTTTAGGERFYPDVLEY